MTAPAQGSNVATLRDWSRWQPDKISGALIVSLVLALSLAIFFRVPLFSGFDWLFGDTLDSMIENAILEHWYNVWRGRAEWHTTNYYFPHRWTLGYNDGYLYYGIVYSLFRFAGFDPFLSSELLNIVLRAVGFLAFFAFARRAVGLPFLWSLLGAALFTLHTAMYWRMLSPQLLTVGFAPLLALLIVLSCRAFLSGHDLRGFAWGSVAAVFFAGWLLTTFYMAWFFAFFAAAFVCVAVATSRFLPILPDLKLLARHWRAIAAIGVVSGFAVVPFLYLYLPKASETGQHPFETIALYSPSVIDTFHVGEYNLVWGWLDLWIHDWLRPGFPLFSERTTGFPLALLLLWAIACLWLMRRPTRERHPWLVILALTTAVTWVLNLHYGSWAPWYYVWLLVPGAKAIRIVARYQIFLAFPVIVIAMAFLANIRWTPSRVWLLSIVSAVLLLEQINFIRVHLIDRPHELAILRRFSAPPAECRLFFSVGKRPGGMLLNAELDAAYNPYALSMLVAETLGIPTINGITAFFPPDANLGRSDSPDYLSRVARYVMLHKLEGVCGLDMRSGKWLPVSILDGKVPLLRTGED
jgi:hypothetical protein